MTEPASSVCLIVPCYNEARRLDVHAFEHFLRHSPDMLLCFVNDGSSDGTLAVLQSLQRAWPERVMVIDQPDRRGKGEAVRAAMLQAREWRDAEFFGFWDADLATPLDEVHSMLRLAHGVPGCLMVLGSRVKRLGATITRKTWRHYLGRVFATVASLLLGLPVYDTQCGAKLVNARVVPQLFAEPFVSRWIFDVELLARLRNLVGVDALLATTIEAPLGSWRDVSGSKLRLAYMLSSPYDLWRIGRHYNQSGRGKR